jgi:plastocyanin
MTHRITLPALALGLLLASTAAAQDYDDPTGGDPNPPTACAGVEAKITIGNGTSFTPSTITVDVGQPVCWTWSTSIQHNVKLDNGAFASGQPTDKGTFQYTFTAPGTYGYYCQVHGTTTGGMRGTVIVRDSSGGGGGGGGGTSGSGPGKLELSSAYSVNENAGSASITVERTGGSDGAASVKIQTTPGSAKPGKDFTPRNGTLSWANGDQTPKTFAVPIKNDSAPEQDETFTIKLSKATGASMGTSSAAVTIHDDDGPGCGAGVTAPSKLRAQGQSAGEIRLTWADESSAASAVRIERREPGGAFQEIASVSAGAGVTSFVDSGLSGGATFQYRIRTEGSEGASPYSAIAAGATDGSAGACDGARALCLQNGRFEAKVLWRPSETEIGREAKRLTMPEDRESGGLFALAPNDGPQLLLKVFDGCAVNGHYGLDLAGLSDAEFTVKVRDTRTGRTWVYFSPGGGAPAPVHDVDAFSCR